MLNVMHFWVFKCSHENYYVTEKSKKLERWEIKHDYLHALVIDKSSKTSVVVQNTFRKAPSFQIVGVSSMSFQNIEHVFQLCHAYNLCLNYYFFAALRVPRAVNQVEGLPHAQLWEFRDGKKT